MVRHWLLALLLIWPLAVIAAAPPRIGVMTMQPGEVFFERFGHDALVVADPDGTPAISYNFGYFDPSEPDFIARFVKGRMMYYLLALPLQDDLQQYREVGRGVSIQWLDLPATQATSLAAALAQRSRPENARYHYDYFTANCATMVRDSLDQAMGGTLRRQLLARSAGNSYRSEAVRLASPVAWMWIGFDLGLSRYADRPLSRWEDAFVPMHLASSLAQARNSEGRPLVLRTEQLLPQRLAPEPAVRARLFWPWLLTGLALAGAILALARRPRLLATLGLGFWLLCALAGALLLYLWAGTAHQAAWANRNLLLLNPLALVALFGAVTVLRGRRPRRWFGALLWLLAGSAALALPAYWLASPAQANLGWIALLLPIHLAFALALAPPRPRGERLSIAPR